MSIFDNLYKNRPVIDNKDIYRNFNLKEELKETITEEEEQIILTRLLNESRKNRAGVFTEREVNALNNKYKRVQEDALRTLDKIAELKNKLDETIKKSETSYSLDISNNENLKKAANGVFGGNKTLITYDDYMTLLEMRNEIQHKEIKELTEDIYA